MKKSIEYVNHLGERVNLFGDGIYCDSKGLDDWSLGYSTLGGRSFGFRRSQKTLNLSLKVITKSKEEGFRARNRLFEVAEKDIMAETPGRLIYDGWYVHCWLVESEKDMYWFTGKAAEYQIKALVDDPAWVKEHELSMSKDGTGTGLNFPYNFPYNFAGSSKEASYINNPGIMGAPVRMTIYGPASNPRVIVGGNRYEVEVEVKGSGKLVIDGMGKTITLYDEYGNSSSVFSKRLGVQRQGSGSYVFQPVAPGENLVSWDRSFAFDIVLFERRSERRWGA